MGVNKLLTSINTEVHIQENQTEGNIETFSK